MLTCRDVCENAQNYVDKNAPLWTRLRIRLHMAMCRNCTNFVDQTRKTKQLISQSLQRDTLSQVSLELIAAANELKASTGSTVAVALIGAEAAALTGAVSVEGVDEIVTVAVSNTNFQPEEWAAAATALIEARSPSLVEVDRSITR